MKVSFSAISTFMRCPAAYAFKYREGLRVIRPQAHFEIGSIIHAALEPILFAHARGERLPDIESAVREGCSTLREKRDMTLDSEEHAQIATAALEWHVPRMRLESWETLMIDGKPAVELELEVPFEGATLQAHIDWIARSRSTGKVWIIDHKTSKNRLTDQCYVEFDLQLALYREAATLAGIERGGSLLHQLCTTPPSKVAPLKRPSKGRLFSAAKNQRTDWETYQNALIQHGQDPKDYADIQDMLNDQCSKSPFRRWVRDVTSPECHTAMIDLARLAVRQMRKIKEGGAPALPTRVNAYTCERCDMRPWCDATLAEQDPTSLVYTVYQPDADSPHACPERDSGTAALAAYNARTSRTGRYDLHGWNPHKA
jgi:RecB family exonuclease